MNISMKSRGRTRIVLAGLITAVVLLVLGWAVYGALQPKQPVYDTTSEAYQQLQRAKKATKPADDARLTIYYMNIASAYRDLGDTRNALENYLIADKYREKSRSEDTTFNIAIAQLYRQQGDEQKAKQYFQREIDRAKADTENSESNAAFIRQIEKEMEEL